jgi:hypothetical protein
VADDRRSDDGPRDEAGGRRVAWIPDHEEAMRYILSAAEPGDLVVINTNLIAKVLALLEGLEAGRLKPVEGRPAIKAPVMATSGGIGGRTATEIR